MLLKHLRDLSVEAPLASGHAFLSAASGLVVIDGHHYVVGDDEHHLAMFPKAGAEKGRLMRLFPGELPRDAKQRKAQKPDLEMLLSLPIATDGRRRRLLTLGSGSTEQRRRGVLAEIDDAGLLCDLQLLDLQGLYAALEALVPELNLEGAVAQGDALLLFNRGNMANPATHILTTPLSAVIDGTAAEVSIAKELQLPSVKGVPLSVTDACLLDDGAILVSTVAEATDNSYADGALAGSALVLLDTQFGVIAIEEMQPKIKVEGLSGHYVAGGIELLCVTDADNPAKAAGLYSGLWRI